jgi:predicted nucleic acid-binding protein
LTAGAAFWTGDKRLHRVADRLRLAASPADLR